MKRFCLAIGLALAPAAHAQIPPVTSCTTAGIGAAALTADGPAVSILEVSAGTAGSGATAVPYCLVKVLVPQAINIWVGAADRRQMERAAGSRGRRRLRRLGRCADGRGAAAATRRSHRHRPHRRQRQLRHVTTAAAAAIPTRARCRSISPIAPST